MIIPPRATAVPSDATAAGQPTPRDRHTAMVAAKGRMGWQAATGYGRRSLVTIMLPAHVQARDAAVRPHALDGYDQLKENADADA